MNVTKNANNSDHGRRLGPQVRPQENVDPDEEEDWAGTCLSENVAPKFQRYRGRIPR